MKRNRISKTDDIAIKGQLSEFEAALADGVFKYYDIDTILDMLSYYMRNDQAVNASKLLNYGLKIHPDDTDLLLELAYLAIDSNHLKEAKEIAAKINEPENPDVILLNLEINLHEGKLDNSVELLKNLSPMDCRNLEVVLSIADIYSLMGYYDYALEWLKKIKEDYSENHDYISKLADVYSDSGETEMAVSLYNKLIDDDPYDVDIWLSIARCYYRNDRFEDSIEPCEFALAADQESGEAYAMLANAYMQMENFEKAEEAYKGAIKYHGIQEDSAHAFLGLCYSGQEKFEDACREFGIGVELHKKTPSSAMEYYFDEVLLNYGYCLGQIGLFDKACRTVEQVLKEHPNDVNANITALKLYIDGCKEEKIGPALKKCSQLVMEDGSPTEMITLSECYACVGNFKEALNVTMTLFNRTDVPMEVLPSVVNCLLCTGDFKGFCQYNRLMEEPVSVEDAYNKYIDMCAIANLEPKEFSQFERMIKRIEKELDEEEKENKKDIEKK